MLLDHKSGGSLEHWYAVDAHMGVSQNSGYHFEVAQNKDYRALGFTLEFPLFWAAIIFELLQGSTTCTSGP